MQPKLDNNRQIELDEDGGGGGRRGIEIVNRKLQFPSGTHGNLAKNPIPNDPQKPWVAGGYNGEHNGQASKARGSGMKNIKCSMLNGCRLARVLLNIEH
jgi:hypothetical protein